MAKLTFTKDAQLGYLSNEFSGGVVLQCLFPTKGKKVIFIDSRLGNDLPWTTLRSVVVEQQSVFSINVVAEGQEFRLRTGGYEPESVDVAQITNSGSGSGSGSGTIPTPANQDGEVNTLQEVLDAFRNFPEGTTIQEALEAIEGGGLQEEDIEDVFFPKEVSAISAGEDGANIVLMLTGENIDDEDEIDWLLTMDGVEHELAGLGRTLTLSGDLVDEYNAAERVTAKVTVASYESSTYVLKS